MSAQEKLCPHCGAPFVFIEKKGWDGDRIHSDMQSCDCDISPIKGSLTGTRPKRMSLPKPRGDEYWRLWSERKYGERDRARVAMRQAEIDFKNAWNEAVAYEKWFIDRMPEDERTRFFIAEFHYNTGGWLNWGSYYKNHLYRQWVDRMIADRQLWNSLNRHRLNHVNPYWNA